MTLGRNSWSVVLASTMVIVLGVGFAVVKIGGLGLVDELTAGSATVEDAAAFDSMWQILLLCLLVSIVVEGYLRVRWQVRWLGIASLPASARRAAMRDRLQSVPVGDRWVHRGASLLANVGAVAIVVALAVSFLYADSGALRLTFVAKAIAGLAYAASSAAFIGLVLRTRNTTLPVIEVARSRVRRDDWP